MLANSSCALSSTLTTTPLPIEAADAAELNRKVPPVTVTAELLPNVCDPASTTTPDPDFVSVEPPSETFPFTVTGFALLFDHVWLAESATGLLIVAVAAPL